MKKTLFTALAAAAFMSAYAENLDSLNAEIERLNAQLEAQRAVQTAQTTQAQTLHEAGETENAQTAQTLQTVPTAQAAPAAQVAPATAAQTAPAAEQRVALEESAPKTEKSTRRQISGAGGLGVGVLMLDARPVKNYLRDLEKVQRGPDQSPNPLANSGLSARMQNREPMFLIGGTGRYQSPENGAIIGGGGYGAYTSVSNRVAGALVGGTTRPDTVHTLHLGLGYGGVVVGGGWKNERNAFSITSLIGAGGMGFVTERKYTGSVFDNDRNNSGNKNKNDDDDDDDDDVYDGAGFFALELNLSYLHSFTRWFHFGVEGGALLAYSRRGFDLIDGFSTVNPTVKAMFIFGWL